MNLFRPPSYTSAQRPSNGSQHRAHWNSPDSTVFDLRYLNPRAVRPEMIFRIIFRLFGSVTFFRAEQLPTTAVSISFPLWEVQLLRIRFGYRNTLKFCLAKRNSQTLRHHTNAPNSLSHMFSKSTLLAVGTAKHSWQIIFFRPEENKFQSSVAATTF